MSPFLRREITIPLYNFICENCNKSYEALTSYDEANVYPTVTCPKCSSDQKKKIPSTFAFNFSDPVGTDRWNSDSGGHDYRYKQNIPKVQEEREHAAAASHMGADPYDTAGWDTSHYNEGITDLDES